MLDNPITKNYGNVFFVNSEPVVFEFRDRPLFLGDTYYMN